MVIHERGLLNITIYFSGFIMWSICPCSILKRTKMLLLGFMHRFGFKLKYGGQKMGTTTVF